MKIGYAPFSSDLSSPTDRFRFGSYLRSRGLDWEAADPKREYDAAVISLAGDLSIWSKRAESRMPIVFDIVDPYMFTRRGSASDRLRAIGKCLGGDFSMMETSFRDVLDRMLQRADIVVSGSQVQATYIEKINPNVRVILDDHADTVRETKYNYSRGETLNLVWEGMLGNVGAFREVVSVLGQLLEREHSCFHVLTNLEAPKFLRRYGKVRATEVAGAVFGGQRVELYSWCVETVSRIFTTGDIALIPVPSENEFYRAKSASKLLLAARHGLPILCSSTPAYEAFAEASGVPMTCRSEAEWREKFAALAEDEGLREAWGTRVRSFSEQEFSSAALHRQWSSVLSSVGVTL